MSPVLIFLAFIVAMLVAGAGANAEEYTTAGRSSEATVQKFLAFMLALIAVLLAYCAGYWAPR